MPQGLVAASRVSVVVRMSLEVNQYKIRGDVVGIPGVVRLAALIPPVRAFFPQQPVVLDVVRAGQLPPCKSHLDQEERQDLWTEGQDQPAVEHHRNGVRLQDLVVQAPRTVAAALEAPLLKSPGAL